jgi:hypothetical protein
VVSDEATVGAGGPPTQRLRNDPGSVTETAGRLRTVVAWEGEAPAELGARNRHSVRLALPKTPPTLSRTQLSQDCGAPAPCRSCHGAGSP